MTFRDKVYTLREEAIQSVTRHYISFTDNQGGFHDVEVSELLYIEFRQLERKNRNLQQSDQRHKEFSELTDETLNRRARFIPKSVDEQIIEEERNGLLYKVIAALPEIQRRRFLLYYEYDYSFQKISEMEHCTPQAVRCSVILARKKIKAQMRKYLYT